LSWDPSQDADGYMFYYDYDNATGEYHFSDDVDNQTSYPITEFLIRPQDHYYFAVTAYRYDNETVKIESGFSEYHIDFRQYDYDDDYIIAFFDNCPDVYNPSQEDTDANGIGDACETPITTTTTSIPSGGSNSGSGGGDTSGGGYGDSTLQPECIVDMDCQIDYLCDTKNGVCVECMDDSHCDDGLYCNGNELCHDNKCIGGTNPCDETEVCDEENDRCLDCESNMDCDDGIFCNGAELCDDGGCVEDKEPCVSDEICMEDVDQCWNIEKLTALSLRDTLARPIFRKKRCPWLVLKSEEDNHFNKSKYSITIEGQGDDALGVEIDYKRSAFKILGFILVPVCIEYNATIGQWTIEIETLVGDADNPFNEIIYTTFQIR